MPDPARYYITTAIDYPNSGPPQQFYFVIFPLPSRKSVFIIKLCTSIQTGNLDESSRFAALPRTVP